MVLRTVTHGTTYHEHSREDLDGFTPADLILNKSILLSNLILSPPGSVNPLIQVALSDTTDNWVARQYYRPAYYGVPNLLLGVVHTTCWSRSYLIIAGYSQ
jgi:hypothetical protein